jgi:mono/diheme cytochrome c family protein
MVRIRLFPVVLVAALTPALCAAQASRPAAPRSAGAQRAPDLVAGQTLFNSVCTACHSLQPPPKLAPPMAMVSQHYRDAFASESDARAAMLAFLLAPDTSRATMPAHAIQRFGLMPKLPLSEQQFRDVSAYIWSLSAPAKAP